MKKVQVFSVLVCLLFSYAGFEQNVADKTNMRVLYLGYNPEKPILNNSNYMDWNSERFKINFISRWPAFIIYLKSHFADVFSVDARDYKQELSAPYDVTIFDEVPPSIKEAVRKEDANGQVIKYEPAVYLSGDYNHAIIFVGKVGPDMGRSLGSKLDWHCYCLDADAVNIKTDHAIFNTPVKVDLTLVNKETPVDQRSISSGRSRLIF